MLGASGEEAEGGLEIADVEVGEYLVIGDDATIFNASVEQDRVVVSATEIQRPEELRMRLEPYGEMIGLDLTSDDPIAAGNASLREEWSHRWLKRPAWLARRLRGERPPQL